jgi:hypothetical protein
VAFGDAISSKRREQIVRESDARQLLRGPVLQKRAFASTEEIFSPLFNDVVQACRELT